MSKQNLENRTTGLLGRMDFEVEVIQGDEDVRTATFRLIPDPRRYDICAIDGETHFFDKYLRTAISETLMRQICADRAKDVPFYALSANIDSAPNYAASREAALKGELQGGGLRPASRETQRSS